jgi:membrane associated rhomboid family serine protease
MTEKDKEKNAFVFRLLLAAAIVSVWWGVALLDAVFEMNIRQYGVKPRVGEGVLGIFTYPFIHGSWQHLVSNTLPGVILLTALFVFHSRRSFVVLFVLYLTSGTILWLIGREGSNHIGASGVIYALAFFLFTAGFIERNRSSLAVSFFIILWYGGMLWGIFPFSVESGTSWEGHLAGAISGTSLALLITERTLQQSPAQNNEITEEEHFYETHRIEDV